MKQNMEALEKANVIRRARATLKWEILNKEKTVVAVLKSPPAYTGNMPIIELLQCQQRWGRTRARKLLSPLYINEKRQIGDLTPRQRDLIIEALEC